MIDPADRLNIVEEYYFSKKLREISELEASGKSIINMGVGSPDLQPPSQVVEVLKNSLNDEKAHQYQSYKGLPELRKAIANFYKEQYYVRLNSETDILPLMGSKEGIMHISMAFLNPGDEVLIPNPGYPTYASVTNLVGAKPVFYNLIEENKWLPDLSQLAAQDLTKVKLMWISYPHMPTGAKATKKVFEDIVEFAKKHKILVVNDNPYSFILNGYPLSFLNIKGSKEIGLELNSISKSFNMAGWRVGMVVGKKKYIESILKVKSNMDSGMFYGLQKGAIKALQSGAIWFSSLTSIYRQRRELVWELAEILNCTYDKHAAGLFVWARLPEESSNSIDYVDLILKNKGVFITPGRIFGSQGEGYIRFSLCVDEELIQEAINRF